jgi:hypothetical protein
MTDDLWLSKKEGQEPSSSRESEGGRHRRPAPRRTTTRGGARAAPRAPASCIRASCLRSPAKREVRPRSVVDGWLVVVSGVGRGRCVSWAMLGRNKEGGEPFSCLFWRSARAPNSGVRATPGRSAPQDPWARGGRRGPLQRRAKTRLFALSLSSLSSLLPFELARRRTLLEPSKERDADETDQEPHLCAPAGALDGGSPARRFDEEKSVCVCLASLRWVARARARERECVIIRVVSVNKQRVGLGGDAWAQERFFQKFAIDGESR